MLLQQVGESFPVIFERIVKIGEVVPPRPVVTAVSRFGQIADGNVGAGIVFPHEQGEVALAEIAAHEDFAEVVVEFPVVVHDGGEQGIHLCEDLRKFLLLVGLVAADNLQIFLFPIVFLCKVNGVGYGDSPALEQVGHEFGSIHRISGFFDVLYDLFDFGIG